MPTVKISVDLGRYGNIEVERVVHTLDFDAVKRAIIAVYGDVIAWTERREKEAK